MNARQAPAVAVGARRYREIAALAWPVFIGQTAVMANGVIDTVMAGRQSSTDIAAIGLGASVYITVYATWMGVLLALSPIVAQDFGGRRLDRVGIDFAQGLWLALLLSVPGCLVLTSTGLWFGLSHPPAQVAEGASAYLWAVAAGLPAALLFRVLYALNNALSRPKVVMAINLVGLLLKIPLNALFMQGADLGGWQLPALGGPGCGVATAVIAWVSIVIGLAWTVLDPWYRQFKLFHRLRPEARGLIELLRLGMPIGASYLVEVTSFTFMALFVARLGATVGASHQIASNMTGVLYMSALGIASATSVLTAQALGAGTLDEARRTIRTGTRMMFCVALSLAAALFLLRRTIAGWYTTDAAVIEAAAPLLAMVAAYHVFDATQTLLVNVLRAHKIVLLPTAAYVLSLWGVGLAGGWWLTFDADPAGWLGIFNGQRSGALGFWAAGIGSVALASAGLALILRHVWRRPAARILPQT